MSNLAGFSSTSFTPDKLIVSLDDCVSRKVTLLSGAGALLRGTILGKITLGAVTETHAGNTGTGAMTIDATTPLLAGAQLGVYTALCTAAASNAGMFTISDPKGNILGTCTVAGAAFANQIKFTIADATDFIVGDKFLITVAAGSGKYLKSLAAAVDGSQVPDCILTEDADASAADVDVPGYFRGMFNDAAVIYGAGHTAASVVEGLRVKGIDLIPVQPA